MQRLRLAAYGNTVYLKGIAACLACHSGLTVVHVDPETADAQDRLNELKPDIIAFEHCGTGPPTPMDMLHDKSTPLLVLIVPDREEILLLSSTRTQPATAADLAEVLLGAVAERT